MPHLKGAVMYLVAGVVVAVVMLSTNNGLVALVDRGGDEKVVSADQRAQVDVTALLTAARGAPPIICALAAQSLRNYGWGDWSDDAPSTPLSFVALHREHDFGPEALPPADLE